VQNNYVVLFTIYGQAFTGWVDGLSYLIFFAIGCGIAIFSSGSARLFGIVAALFALVAAFSVTQARWNEFVRLKHAFRTHQYFVVMGVVENFQGDAGGGKGTQSFRVEGTSFAMSAHQVSFAFRQTVGVGGPNLSGGCVKIGFVAAPQKCVVRPFQTQTTNDRLLKANNLHLNPRRSSISLFRRPLPKNIRTASRTAGTCR